ncbi:MULTISPECIES: hypothetical protein [unclassified Streptomyces]|uniref:TolB family protein n=1 Tax=unclassified Streptomyces TaxID=2593676 RepID=UPI000DDC0029|nr:MULTISPECIES: hypothetical protein [unclassified Streptomyces]QZZ32024.1 hypothetical protein A7X85_42675 [Streptomyces sp. ST1015]
MATTRPAHRRGFALITALLAAVALLQSPSWAEDRTPEPPAPERIEVEALPLPPTAPSEEQGACTRAVNPRGTGCLPAHWDSLQTGAFTSDGRHITAVVEFTGAPAAPDPASVYEGQQVILIKTDSRTFPNGDPWKCLTCGIPAENRQGVTHVPDHPQPFPDGRRIHLGNTVLDCGRHAITSPRCTPQRARLYPIRWNVTPDGSGEGGDVHEVRLHPDGVHIGYSSVARSGGRFDQHGYLGRLEFNPAPSAGEPLVPRYDVTRVNRLYDPAPEKQPVHADPRHPGRLVFDPQAPSVGELRGFSKDGREVFYVGHPRESANLDLFAADLRTGEVRRVTAHPEYTDPVDSSPDDKWVVAMDTRGSDRQMFVAGMRGVPPVTDLVSTAAVSSVRNNQDRRFFQPYLIDRYGDRGDYAGQQLNAGDGRPGSASDPNWNAKADPHWSPNGTSVVYAQRLVSAPSCGGVNPLPCPESTEPGGRRARLMIAHLVDREPVRTRHVVPAPDHIRWGEAYQVGTPAPVRPYPPQGTYTMRGAATGSATVEIVRNGVEVRSVKATYRHYSDDGRVFLNGTESVTRTNLSLTNHRLDWHSDLVQSGAVRAEKKTSPDGFHLTIDVFDTEFNATGTLTTTVDGRTYTQPANGT